MSPIHQMDNHGSMTGCDSARDRVDGIFTYYTGPVPATDDTSMLVGKNDYLETKKERVLDLRHLPKPLESYNHEENGFQLFSNARHPAENGDIYSDAVVQTQYRPELHKFIKDKLGARLCILWGHLVRDTPREQYVDAVPNGDGPNHAASHGPAASGTTAFHLVHCDFSPRGCRAFLRAAGASDYFQVLNNSFIPEDEQKEFRRLREKIISAEEAAMRKAGIDPTAECNGKGGHWDWDGEGYDGPRYGVATLWQPLQPVERDSIAISVSPDHNVRWTSLMRKYAQRGHDSMGQFYFENMLVQPEPAQEWVYISNMQPSEVLLIKFFDTKAVQSKDGSMRSMRTHGAFHIPGTERFPPRQSIETKLFFFYDDE